VIGLSAQDLTVALGGRMVLSDLSLDLEPGAFTVLAGPNGAGKSTLLRTLAGLLAPATGDVLFGGTSIRRMAPQRRARAIAYLPQDGSIAWPLPVIDIVALGRLPHGERPGRLGVYGRSAVSAALAQVGLGGFEARPASLLSGGERARVLLARALAVEAPVLLVDEPVAALDPRHQLLVLEGLAARASQGGIVVAIMHDLSLAARYADRIALLDSGNLLDVGPPLSVFTEQRIAEVFGISARVSILDGRPVITPERPLVTED
jgi:iron complex transport system ATP-binding protein